MCDRWTGFVQVSGEFVEIRHEHVWHGIVDMAKQVSAKLIVLGCRGLNTLRRTLMGSVSNAVVHHANCPVLVCRHPKHVDLGFYQSH